MSRSATCMRDLVRQEVSDYVNNKSQPLPSLHSPRLSSAHRFSNKTAEIKLNTNSLYVPQSLPCTPENEACERPHSESKLSDKHQSETDSSSELSPRTYPSPPCNPKPTKTGRCGATLRRHKYHKNPIASS